MVLRVYTEKKDGFNVSAKKIKNELKSVLGISAADVREFLRYDAENIDRKDFDAAKATVFAEAPADVTYEESLPPLNGYYSVVIEYLPGQYDQRADSAAQCIQLITMKERPEVRCARVISVKGVTVAEFEIIKKYLINPVESREGTLAKPDTLIQETVEPQKAGRINGFAQMSDQEIFDYHKKNGFAMSLEDLKFVQKHFREEMRDPTITELKVIDTYWSDHCRHTTFFTELDEIDIESDNPHIKEALEEYESNFEVLYSGRDDKYKCMMDIATLAAKKLKAEGRLKNLDESDEINACSVVVDVDNDGRMEQWLIMFKNETHNHPTEIEPFGGAATCLGGAIRDPLSGRTYVYQAMRVTGSGDPTKPLSATIPGKLPQRVITTTAASGFSSYGNQIGLATGIVAEMYHERYRAKRLETGYVIGGAPRHNVIRRKPQKGDVIILLGGETGRDGCGGATGSSKAHTATSVEECGAEVQKGNPITERKIQRLLRNREASTLIVKCNDFGAGGVSVAIGELAESLDIFLDKVPKKYEGLDATELAISESQERMAVVVAAASVKRFVNLAGAENLAATPVAEVTDTGYLRMYYKEDKVVDLKRAFLDTNGVKQHMTVKIRDNVTDFMEKPDGYVQFSLDREKYRNALVGEISRLQVCSQKGLGEMFDSTIGANTVIMPFGGKYQLTPAQVMAAKPPVSGETDTATVSAWACYPYLMEKSPFTGAIYAITASVSKLVASGVPYDTIRLTLQEFFKKLGKDPERWGEPVSALLGAFYAQKRLGLAAIGGKDSMSGSFEDFDVPPTLISFAMGIGRASRLITNVFEEPGKIYRIRVPRDEFGIPDFDRLKEYYQRINKFIYEGSIIAAAVVEDGGVASAVLKGCMGNGFGFKFGHLTEDEFAPAYGDFIVQTAELRTLYGVNAEYVGTITEDGKIRFEDIELSIGEVTEYFEETLEKVFPSKARAEGIAENSEYREGSVLKQAGFSFGAPVPRVLIPVFPGTNCEYDTARAFEKVGGRPTPIIIKNRTAQEIEQSCDEIARMIRGSQIIAFPGGFSGGDEPDGSAKFIVAAFNNPKVRDAVADFLNKRDGLIIGICNGFQALIKLGLLPYGKIKPQLDESPTLTFNNIKRHVSTVARIRVASNNSPWLSQLKVGDIYNVPVSHGEGRFVAADEEIGTLMRRGQIAFQYVDLDGNATMQSPYNPNGSDMAIEGIVSHDGRVLGKMGHTERFNEDLYKNVPGNFDMTKLFKGGVDYFK